MTDSDREQATQGALILHRLVPAPDHGAGWKRDPETGFVFYSSEWLSDERPEPYEPHTWTTRHCEMEGCEAEATTYRLFPGADSWGGYVCDAHSDPKPSE